jgi:hypothetical protein
VLRDTPMARILAVNATNWSCRTLQTRTTARAVVWSDQFQMFNR